MAEVVGAFPASTKRVGVTPYAQYMDGQIWKLQHGVDFHVSRASFKAGVAYHANIRGKRALTHAPQSEPDTIYVQVLIRERKP